ISMVSISLEGFLLSILLLVVIIVAVVIVTVILVVVVINAIVRVVIVVIYALVSGPLVCEICWWLPPESEVLKQLSVCIPPRQGIIDQGIYLGPVFLLGLSAFAMAVACASRAVATPSIISCRMVALVIAGVADVDVLLGGIYQHIHANTE
nr:hypothetical protein [Tanacetum cinerariifolium]